MIAALLLVSACSSRAGFTYEVPASFEGWVTVDFAIPEAQAVPAEVLRVHTNGRARTRSALPTGPARYADDQGHPLPVLEDEGLGYDAARAVTRDTRFVCCRANGTSSAEGKPGRTFEQFYVGRGPAGTTPDP